jgi:DNA replication protein DnaC
MSESQTLILPRLVYDAEVLVLDDFGSQRWSGWVQDMMSAVISNRYDHHQPTLITTNLSDKASVDRVKARSAYLKKLGVMNAEGDIDNFQLQRLENCGIYLRPPRDEPVTLEDQIGERLRSRLYEMCELIPMYGADYRRSLQKQSHER